MHLSYFIHRFGSPPFWSTSRKTIQNETATKTEKRKVFSFHIFSPKMPTFPARSFSSMLFFLFCIWKFKLQTSSKYVNVAISILFEKDGNDFICKIYSLDDNWDKTTFWFYGRLPLKLSNIYHWPFSLIFWVGLQLYFTYIWPVIMVRDLY